MKSLIKDFKKYKWFITSHGKTVIGGKNASQNDELLGRIKSIKSNLLVMHTSSPGSPFSVILSPISDIKKKEIEECAIFTGSFSQVWKKGGREALVDIFRSDQLYKSNGMKEGMWGVKEKIERIKVPLKLSLTRQSGFLRAVPEISLKSKNHSLLTIIPGKEDKKEIFAKLDKNKFDFTLDEFLSALPAGGSKIL